MVGGTWNFRGRVEDGGLGARNSHPEEPRSLLVLCAQLTSFAFATMLASLAYSHSARFARFALVLTCLMLYFTAV